MLHRALSKAGLEFRALPRSKPLRFSDTLQEQTGLGVHFVPFPVLSSPGDQVLGECTVPGGPCILITSLVLTTEFPTCTARAPSQAYIEELYKKDLHDSDNHDGVITHLEEDILESEVKWALGSFTTNKASGGDGIPVELFQILKDDTVKVLHSICQQIWKTQQWPQDWKRSVFIPIPKKGNSKECSNYTKDAQNAQLHSSHMLAK